MSRAEPGRSTRRSLGQAGYPPCPPVPERSRCSGVADRARSWLASDGACFSASGLRYAPEPLPVFLQKQQDKGTAKTAHCQSAFPASLPHTQIQRSSFCSSHTNPLFCSSFSQSPGGTHCLCVQIPAPPGLVRTSTKSECVFVNKHQTRAMILNQGRRMRE